MERRRSNGVCFRPNEQQANHERGELVRTPVSTSSITQEALPISNPQFAASVPRFSWGSKFGAVFSVAALLFVVVLLVARQKGEPDSLPLQASMRRAQILELDTLDHQRGVNKRSDSKQSSLSNNYKTRILERQRNSDIAATQRYTSEALTNATFASVESLQSAAPALSKIEASGSLEMPADIGLAQTVNETQLQAVQPENQTSAAVRTPPSVLDILESNRTKCPLQYDRISYEDIKKGKYQPYLLGERAKPECNNCDRDELWSHFCQFQTHGPVCPGWLKWQLSSDWVERAEQGSPGLQERLTMTPCDLFPFIRGRTLWLLGDSLTLEWDKAVQCFLFEFWDLQQRDLPVIHPIPPYEFQGWCAHMAQEARVCFVRGNTGDQFVDGVLPNLAALGAKPTDLMVLNFAVWHNSESEYIKNMTRFTRYIKEQRAHLPIAIWRDAPVQHFDTGSGDYVWPIPSQECKALPEVELQQDNSLVAKHPSAQIVAEGGWRNRIALPVMQFLGIPIIHTWNQSLPMWQYHTNYSEKDGDCTHMCHPSEYQYWVFELYQTLKGMFPDLVVSW